MKAYCGFSINTNICNLIDSSNEENDMFNIESNGNSNSNSNNKNDKNNKNGKKKRYSIATGNWGCGVFRGDFELKFLLQWIACSLTNDKDLIYFSFGDPGCKYFESFIQIMTDEKYNITVGDLWKYLLNYSKLIDTRYNNGYNNNYNYNYNNNNNNNNNNNIPSVFEYIVSFYKNEELVGNPLLMEDNYDSNSSGMLEMVLKSTQNDNQEKKMKRNKDDNNATTSNSNGTKNNPYVSDDDDDDDGEVDINGAQLSNDDQDSFDDSHLLVDSEDELLAAATDGAGAKDNADNADNADNDDVAMHDS